MNKKLMVSLSLLMCVVLIMMASKLNSPDSRNLTIAAILGLTCWLAGKAFDLFAIQPHKKVRWGDEVAPIGTFEQRLDFIRRLEEWQKQEFKSRYFNDQTERWLWEDASDHKRLVVCSAVKYGDLIIPSVRHTSVDRWTMTFGLGLEALKAHAGSHGEQGFLDQWSRFMTRKEAYQVAVAAGQIDPTKTPQPDTLFSEDLYP